MKQKAQLKIQQMTFMLLAVTLFFVLIGMFFLTMNLSNLKQERTELSQKNAMLLATKVANSPELKCSQFQGEEIGCIDADKLMILKDRIDKYDFPGDETFWGSDTNIKVKKIYPEISDKECTFSNYPDCGYIELFDEEISAEYSNFVLLCGKASNSGVLYDKCEIAKLMINYKEWE